MKKFLLSATLIASAFLANAQSQNFNEGNDLSGWNFKNGGVSLYDRPTGTPGSCTQDRGEEYKGNASANNNPVVLAPAQIYSARTASIAVGFDFYVFEKSKLDCGSLKTLDCNATVTAYVVPATYTSTNVPTGSDIIAQETVALHSGANLLTINTNQLLTNGGAYRVFFTTAATCLPANNNLVIDNIIISFTENTVLPVSFKSFNAARNKNTVSLKWETASEQNNKGFYVQRSLGNGEWKDVAFVFSQAENGNSSSVLSYSFNDANLNKGVSQYRLLQVDLNSKGKYSEVRSVRGEEQSSKLIVFPNPSNTGNVNILFDDATSVRDVIVSDLAGRVVKQFKSISGNNLSIENLNDGYYSVQVTNHATATTTVEKVIIKKR